MGPSIQSALEKALETLLQHPINIQAASRTDRGVHARGQVINFFIEKPQDLNQLKHHLNQLLPADISVLKLEYRELDFHPTLHNTGKEYHYLICNDPIQSPFHRELSWHFFYPIDIEKMQHAALVIKGQRDFSAFSNKRYRDPIRRVEKIEIAELDANRLEIRVRGNHFLYKMVRNLVGTIAYIGCGRIPLDALIPILEGKRRSLAGVSAPAHGLYLNEVFY